jgi:hypothetical protein
MNNRDYQIIKKIISEINITEELIKEVTQKALRVMKR